jgi:hypothetical protein
MDGFDIREAREVSCVEGEDALDAVYMHGCNQAGVVDLNAGDAMGHKQLAPVLMDLDSVWQETEFRFQYFGTNQPHLPGTVHSRCDRRAES